MLYTRASGACEQYRAWRKPCTWLEMYRKVCDMTHETRYDIRSARLAEELHAVVQFNVTQPGVTE